MRTKPVQERRSELMQRTDCKFVDSDEFCKLLLGFKRMVRADDSSNLLKGLLDLETGTRFFIEAENLVPASPHSS